MLEEFKKFIMRGNVVDFAIGLIIGAAFQGIVTSMVSDILMPPIGALLKGVDIRDLSFDLPGSRVDPATADKPKAEQKLIPVKVSYGVFIQRIIDFLIVGFCLFLVIKAMNKMQKKKDDSPSPPSASEKLLTEIRDLLKNQTK